LTRSIGSSNDGNWRRETTMPNEKPEELVARVRALCEAATPGPWEAHDGKVPSGVCDEDERQVHWMPDAGDGLCSQVDFDHRPNAEFAAGARTDLPLLADRLEEACRLLERWSPAGVAVPGPWPKLRDDTIAFLNGDGKEKG